MATTLKTGAISMLDAVTMAVAGSAPAYSLSTTTAALAGAVALAGPAALLYAAIPMLGITIAFMQLNRWRADSGTVYSWVGRAMNPYLGYMAGWAMLMSFVLFFAAAAVPAGTATLDLVNPGLAENAKWATGIGAVWFVAIALLTMFGISLTTKFQKVMTGLEVLGLIVLAVGAIVKFGGHPVNHFHWSWFSPTQFGGVKAFMAGMLVAVFYYYGWDVSSNLSEETEDANHTPGYGGFIGTIGVIAIFLLVQVGLQMGLTNDQIQNNSANILPYLGDQILPHPWGNIAVLTVMISTVATFETTLLQAIRTLFSLGRISVMSPRLSSLHLRWQTPWFATIAIGLVSLAVILLSGFNDKIGTLITNLVNAIGLLVAFYYGVSGLACAWYYRKMLGKDLKTTLLLGVWPLLSAIFLFVVAIYDYMQLDPKVTHLTLAVWLAGIVPMLYSRFVLKSEFFTQPREVRPPPRESSPWSASPRPASSWATATWLRRQTNHYRRAR